VIKKITEVELEKPNFEPILIFHCSSRQKEIPFEEAHYVTGHCKFSRTGCLRTFLLYRCIVKSAWKKFRKKLSLPIGLSSLGLGTGSLKLLIGGFLGWMVTLIV